MEPNSIISLFHEYERISKSCPLEIKSFDECYREQIASMRLALSNVKLLWLYKRFATVKYNSVAEALSEHNPSHVLLYFSELQKYGAFNKKNYSDFIDNLNSANDKEITINYTPLQVVLSGSKHKFICIYISTSEDEVEQLRKIASVKYACGAEAVRHSRYWEIKLDRYMESPKQFREFHDKFNADIGEISAQLAENIFPPKYHQVNGLEYFLSGIKLDPDATEEEKMKALSTYNGPVTINVYNINGNTGVVNINVQAPQVQAGAATTTKDFIQVNSPDGIGKLEYYNSYKRTVRNPVDIRKFAKAVEAEGFRDSRRGTCHIWRRV